MRFRRRFNAVRPPRDSARAPRPLPFFGLIGDLKLAARRLAATPMFLLFAVLSLAIGVAVPTTVYALMYDFMWKPVGVRQPADVALLTTPSGQTSTWRATASPVDFEDLRDAQRSFSEIAAFTPLAHPLVSPTVSRVVDVEAVTGSYFQVAGIDPLLGRLLQPEDSVRALPVAVLSERTWRSYFDADPAIVGRTVKLGLLQMDIVGVAPASFLGLTAGGPIRTEIWVPFETTPLMSGTTGKVNPRDARRLSVVGRLAAGRSLASAAAEMQTIGTRLDADRPLAGSTTADRATPSARRQWRAIAIGARNPMPSIRADLVVLGLTFLVLLVACTNIGNLLLARGASRVHEISVRRALGASRWRLTRELFAESLLIGLVATVATFVLTRGLMWLCTVELPLAQGPLALEPEFNVSAFLVAALALGASLLIFGLEPAFTLTGSNVALHLAGEAGAAPVRRGRRQRAFIRWQVAASVCFFLISAVLAKVLYHEARHDSGIALEQLAVATVHFRMQSWDEVRARRAMDRARELSREYPAIESLAFSSGMPFGLQMTPSAEIRTPDRPSVKGQTETSYVLLASPEIFATLGVPLVRGRGFDHRDGPGSPLVGVISEQTAIEIFGTRDAIGRSLVYHLRYTGTDEAARTVTIIGVARQTDTDRLMSRDTHMLYLPLSQSYLPNMALVARTTGNTRDVARTLETILRRADPELSTGTSGPAVWLTAGPWIAARIAGALAGSLGLLTLILSMVGLYGVQSQVVAHRTREVGVRMALGAMSSQIQRMVLRQGFRPVFEGLAIGLFVGTLVRAGIRTMFAGQVPIFDLMSLLLVPIPLVIAAFCACYLPARRAAKVDPNVALRSL